MMTVMNEPGMKGSAVFGELTKREVSVMSSISNIAHSEVCTGKR